MSTLGKLWFITWRSVLLGLGLGAGLGAAYGLALGAIFYLLVPLGILIGPLLGALYGGLAGLLLGVVCGAVLLIFTLAYRLRDDSRYRSVAGLVCAAATALAVVSCWQIALQLDSGTASLASELMWEEYLAETIILVIVPALIAAGAAWWTGRRVAGQYTREFGEPAYHGPAQARGESPIGKERSQ
jgi:predicted branched-subunit amino acid permease